MRPENKRNLRTAIFLGTVPFKINADGELQFKWCSLTTVYFAIIFFAVAAYQVRICAPDTYALQRNSQAFTTYAMVSTALAADFKESLILFPWTSATFCLLLAQIICLIKRKDIAAFFVTLTDLWAEKIDVDMGNFVYKVEYGYRTLTMCDFCIAYLHLASPDRGGISIPLLVVRVVPDGLVSMAVSLQGHTPLVSVLQIKYRMSRLGASYFNRNAGKYILIGSLLNKSKYIVK